MRRQRVVRAGNTIAIGMRAFLFAVPLVFWLLGAVFLVAATAGPVIARYRLNRPEAADRLAGQAVQADRPVQAAAGG